MTEDSDLTPAELAALEAAGISLDGPAHDPTGEQTVAAGAAALREFLNSSLTPAECASLLGLTEAQVRTMILQRRLLTALRDGEEVIPAWQVVGGQLVPGLEHIATAAGGLHPLSAWGFMTSPKEWLPVGDRAVTPVEWLIAGYDPMVVAEALHGMSFI